MLPTKLTADDPESERRRWAIVRTDLLTTLPGSIISADAAAGTCEMQHRVTRGTAITRYSYNPGPGGFVVVRGSGK